MSLHPPADAALLTGRSRAPIIDDAELGCSLHREVIEPFRCLRAAAAQAGIDLRAVSAFRDFDRQRAIWNAKFRGERPLLDREGRVLEVQALDAAQRVEAILAWSALPGASRHHWGTDLDVYDAAAMPDASQLKLVPGEYAVGGPFAKLNDWLDINLARYGFFRPYCPAPAQGVAAEPWHLSFAPLATRFLAALTPRVLEMSLQDVELEGREIIFAQLGQLHQRYVANVATPSQESVTFKLGEHRRVI